MKQFWYCEDCQEEVNDQDRNCMDKHERCGCDLVVVTLEECEE